MDLFWWVVAIVLMAVGLIGTVLPIFPGTTIILAAAVIHRVMIGPNKSVGWLSIGVLVLFTLASYGFDFASGYFGARRFGATKWGTFGAIIGAVIGIFFGIPGLLIGPVVGAIAGEFIRGRQLVKAGRAGWGAFVGNLAGMIGKLAIALAMVSWFVVAVPSPF